jgi:hypothetical protein
MSKDRERQGRDDIVVILYIEFGLLSAGAEPEFHVIEKVKAAPVDQLAPGGMIFRPEEDSGGEDTFEPILDSPVVEAIGFKVEEVEDFGGTVEANSAGLLLEGERRNPNGDQPVLPERKTVVGMTEYLCRECVS